MPPELSSSVRPVKKVWVRLKDGSVAESEPMGDDEAKAELVRITSALNAARQGGDQFVMVGTHASVHAAEAASVEIVNSDPSAFFE